MVERQPKGEVMADDNTMGMNDDEYNDWLDEQLKAIDRQESSAEFQAAELMVIRGYCPKCERPQRHCECGPFCPICNRNNCCDHPDVFVPF